ncbi:PHD finger protein 10 isoform X2 [Anoplophora glabripennis]|nr:PHD finger protein 10 isoform X2 [Anoplophora glabripennis]
MTSVKNRERILEAIDQLRRRKARPDIQRICNYLFRRFAINSAEARSDLEWCVANNIVLKVEYKGSISYRNAAKKYAQMRQRDSGHQGDSANDNKINRQFSELLTNAFGELIVDEPDYLEIGVPGQEIINNILAKDSVRYTKKYISILLEKEVANGGLIKMENGHYLMGPSKEDESVHKTEKEKTDDWKRLKTETEINTNEVKEVNDRHEYIIQLKPRKRPGPIPKKERDIIKQEHFENMDSSTNSADEKKSENGSLRIGGRRKRAKKVFDPSDTHIPKKRGRPAGSLNKSTIEKQMARLSDESRPDSRTSSNGRDQGGVCSVCHIQSKRGPNDRMVACRECSNKAHFSCLNGDDMMLKMYPDNTWQCPHCKTCVVCYETSDAGYLTVCSVCADGYHASCHQPRIIEKIKNGQKWLCINCQMPDELKINEIQSNIGNSFSQKINGIDNDNSPSNSGNSSPSNYNSPPLSPTPPQLSPQTGQAGESPDQGANSDSQSNKDWDFEENIDPSIPDATHWTADEVYQYFAQYFPEEAKVFKEQEIDGRSLLLLTRIDVLTNLNLKLGPALKIYRHVTKLQVRRDDRKLYWL